MGLGVENEKVRLQAHDVNWKKMAAVLISEVKAVLGDEAISVQHIGSTSIRGIPAKPIIDIVVGVRDVSVADQYVDAMKQFDIEYMGEVNPGQRMFYKVNPHTGNGRSHHIHFVPYDSDDWNNYLNFRDYMNACPEAREIFVQRKTQLAESFPEDRPQYQEGKEVLMKELRAQARAWRAAQTEQEPQYEVVEYTDVDIPVSGNIQKLNALLTQAGYRLYLVGGCVRDALLGRPCHDYDLMTTAPVDEVVKLLFQHQIGFDASAYAYQMAIAVFDDEVLEISTLGEDSLYDNLQKRDFTINSMAYDLHNRKVIDCCGGRKDIEQRILRICPGVVLEYDSNCIIRGMRFALELGFRMDEETYRRLLANTDFLKNTSMSRISREVRKLLLSGKDVF